MCNKFAALNCYDFNKVASTLKVDGYLFEVNREEVKIKLPEEENLRQG